MATLSLPCAESEAQRVPLLVRARDGGSGGARAASGSLGPSSRRSLSVAATLVTVAEARVQVRPVESTVVLEGFRPSDFADPAVQRDFCAAFTASIDLDERVGALDPAPSRRRFPTLRVLRETPRNPP